MNKRRIAKPALQVQDDVLLLQNLKILLGQKLVDLHNRYETLIGCPQINDITAKRVAAAKIAVEKGGKPWADAVLAREGLFCTEEEIREASLDSLILRDQTLGLLISCIGTFSLDPDVRYSSLMALYKGDQKIFQRRAGELMSSDPDEHLKSHIQDLLEGVRGDYIEPCPGYETLKESAAQAARVLFAVSLSNTQRSISLSQIYETNKALGLCILGCAYINKQDLLQQRRYLIDMLVSDDWKSFHSLVQAEQVSI